ncbi:alginate lyase family protein [Marinobacter goseongensis]|uniref:alginate lyase family protein n=1 Tax=Marinobacter goseongensis TaxID=453838 RepID=UPI002002D38B|nr:alginate lyase family protein [Marinobacter goseongensis]MCK7551378.1 alginate lyase family protein [Marinobacter goseongensis]
MQIQRHTDRRQWRRLLLSTAVSTVFFTGAVSAGQCLNGELRAPVGYYQGPAEKDGGDYDCERVEPHEGSLSLTSKYRGSDNARNELNKDAYEEYKQATRNVRRFEKVVVAAADDYQIDGDGPAALDCVMDNLDAWAQADALLTDDINHVGQAVRKWALAASANAYTRMLASAPAEALDLRRTGRIETWFRKLSDGVRGYYTDREPRKVNNHDYWAAWAVQSSAVATQDCGDWNWSMAKFDEAMGQINRDGYLPKELSRETRALEYMNYAMQPLTMIAVLAEVNGVSVYDRYSDVFAPMVRNVISGLEDPQRIRAITGHEQEVDGLYEAWSLAWMEPWQATWGAMEGIPEFLDELRPMKSTRLGGDISYLYRINPLWPEGSQPNPPSNIWLTKGW